MQTSNYEKSALAEIDSFKNPSESLLSKAASKVSAPIESLSETVFDTEVGDVVTDAVKGTMDLLNDGATWTVNQEAIFKEFREDGHPSISKYEDIRALELQEIDKTVGYLAGKYKTAALVEGGVAGTVGIAGFAVDLPALLGLALRACNEYAAYYGFDPSVDAERAFIMHLLSAASSGSPEAKRTALAEVSEISVMISERRESTELDTLMTVELMKKIAEALGVRLAKAKLGQGIPVVGAAIGGTYNAWFLSQITETASAMYRERYLIEKYGSEVAVKVN